MQIRRYKRSCLVNMCIIITTEYNNTVHTVFVKTQLEVFEKPSSRFALT